tara:strand:- start:976 stop:1230 length:255 start_codon:yes stop_codon:yes gene_type:complete
MKDTEKNKEIELDTSGTECPIPVLKARRVAQNIKDGTIVKVIATDPLAEADFQHYCQQTGYIYLGCVKKDKKIIIRFKIKHLRK